MKKLLTMVVGCLLMFAGCKGVDIGGKNTINKNKPERFPDVMVGRWETEAGKSKWAFEFQPDGSIPKMKHAMAGEVDLTGGEAHIEKNKPGGSMEFFLAPCKAKYDPATNEVSIEVIIDYYKIQSPGAVLEGSGTDIFRGPLSKDGKTWKAVWLNYLEIKGKKLNRSTVKPRPIVFTKVDTQ